MMPALLHSIVTSFAVLLLLAALWALNFPASQRFRQRRLALLMGAVCLLYALAVLSARTSQLPWHFDGSAPPADMTFLLGLPGKAILADLLLALQGWGLFEGISGSLLVWMSQLTLFELASLDVLLVAVSAKAATRVFLAARHAISRWFRRMFRSHVDPSTESILDPREELSVRDACYRYAVDGGIVLRNEWYASRLLLRWTAAVATVSLFALLWVTALKWHTSAPLLWALACVALLEAAWYLGGSLANIEHPQTEQDAGQREVWGDYRALWEAYLTKWPEHWLAAISPPPETDLAIKHDLDRLEELLRSGKNVLATRVNVDEASGLLRRAVLDCLSTGRDVVYALPGRTRQDEAAAYLSTLLSEAGDVHRFISIDKWPPEEKKQLAELPRCWIAHLHDLGSSAAEPHTLGGAGLIIFSNVTEALLDPVPTAKALGRLHGCTNKAQFLMFGEPREHLLNALSLFFPEEIHEVRPVRAHANSTLAVVWPAQAGSRYQNELFLAHTEAYLGIEPVLGAFSWGAGVITVRLGDQRNVGWEHFKDAFQNNRNLFLNASLAQVGEQASPPLRNDELQQAIDRLFEYAADSTHSPTDQRAVLLVRDEMCNLPAVIDKWAGKAERAVLLHVVSPHYMLRDYFASNLDYFFQAPFLPLSPKPDPVQCLAWVLGDRMLTSEIEEAEVTRLLERLGNDSHGVITRLNDLMREHVFGDRSSVVQCAERLEYVGGLSRTRRFFSLKKDEKLRDDPQPWQIVDERSECLEVLPKWVALQRYLPDQIHVFDRRYFRILHHDEEGYRTVVRSASPRSGETLYRRAQQLTLTLPASQNEPRHQTWGSARLVQRPLRNSKLEVEPIGHFHFPQGEIVRNAELGCKFYAYDEGQRKVLKQTRENPDIWVFEFSQQLSPQGKAPWVGAEASCLSRTLAFLLGEMLPSLFPGAEGAIHVVSAYGPFKVDTEDYLGRLACKFLPDQEGDGEQPPSEPRVVFYIIEDSPRSQGLANAFMQEWPTIFGLLHDYLCWLLNEFDPNSSTEQSIEPADGQADDGIPSGTARWLRITARSTSSFLAFGQPDCKALPELDLVKVKTFLESLQLGLKNSHNAQRTRFLSRIREGEQVLNPGSECVADKRRTGDPEAAHCDYCRWTQSAEYEITAGRRLVCARCRLTLVDSEHAKRTATEEGYKLFRAGSALAPPDVKVEFIEEFDLISAGLGKTDKAPWTWLEHLHRPASEPEQVFSTLLTREGRLNILVRQGLPYDFTCREILRQLAFVWAVENVDMSGMARYLEGSGHIPGDGPANMRLLIEGAAEWLVLGVMCRHQLMPYLQLSMQQGEPSTFRKRGLMLLLALSNGETVQLFQKLPSAVSTDGPGGPLLSLEKMWPRHQERVARRPKT